MCSEQIHGDETVLDRRSSHSGFSKAFYGCHECVGFGENVSKKKEFPCAVLLSIAYLILNMYYQPGVRSANFILATLVFMSE